METTPPEPSGPADWREGLRFAFGTLTVLPVAVYRWDRAAARGGMVCAPLAGLAVGLLAAALGAALWLLGAGPQVIAVATVAAPAVLTRGLHLDGLADVADGLGSGRPAEDALRVMKRSDIGPFGVVTLVLLLLGQVAAVSELYAEDWLVGALGTVAAATVARAALTLGCREGVAAARPGGLGATVAGTVPGRAALASAAAVALLTSALGAAALGLAGAVLWAAAAVLGLAVSVLLLWHCRRRLGGVTGDVLGALAEVAGTAALLTLVLG